MEPFEIFVDSKGRLTRRESYDLEFKQSFHYGDSLVEYSRSLVGMANNRGGRIIFGIRDTPREPVGLTNEKFDGLDPAKLNAVLLEYFSADISYSIKGFEWNGKQFGELQVLEAQTKPVICRKSNSKILREGAVYYRYRGETKEIRYSELAIILDEERAKEKRLWMRHIEKIGSVGPSHIHILDTVNGELSVGSGSILIDSSVIDQIKFIREGRFVEKDGAPTLKLIGEVSGVLDSDRIVYAESAYPYVASHVLAECSINQYDFQALSWKYGFRGNVQYHMEIRTGCKSMAHKYSKAAVELIRAELRKNPDLIQTVRKQYAKSTRKGKGI